MRKLVSTLILVSIFVISCNRSDTASQVPDGKYIEWRGGNEMADALLKHLDYLQKEKSYSFNQSAKMMYEGMSSRMAR